MSLITSVFPLTAESTVSIMPYGITLSEETSTISCKQAIRLEGIDAPKRGMCVRIYKVLIRDQICFMVMPKNKAKTTFIAMEEAKDPDNNEKVVTNRAVSTISYAIDDTVSRKLHRNAFFDFKAYRYSIS